MKLPIATSDIFIVEYGSSLMYMKMPREQPNLLSRLKGVETFYLPNKFG
ncbi:hypothetical protein RB623_19050 [Mesorhizobium sp. LHD-90]|nr:hypothetical protein [Mesorhizobium sp. LHD-90]MDQ6436161.1 hypothetical protein [Mesorhizobium sp. LHD-90]